MALNLNLFHSWRNLQQGVLNMSSIGMLRNREGNNVRNSTFYDTLLFIQYIWPWMTNKSLCPNKIWLTQFIIQICMIATSFAADLLLALTSISHIFLSSYPSNLSSLDCSVIISFPNMDFSKARQSTIG